MTSKLRTLSSSIPSPSGAIRTGLLQAMRIGFLGLALPAVFALTGARLFAAAVAGTDWPEYLGGPERNHYSALDQINVGNVRDLKKAWEYHTGEPGEMQCNPIVVRGILYGLTATHGVFALDAATGRELWHHSDAKAEVKQVLRGLTYWEKEGERRLLFVADSFLYAIDARNGRPIASFGENGRTSLKVSLGARAQNQWVVSTTPGTLYGDILIMPTRVRDGSDAAPGFIQAFDVRTGRLAWVFHSIPRPGEPGFETWPKDAHLNPNVGGANSWAGMAVDRERGILYVPTGSSSPDFWGGHRLGNNLYANCLLALEARTGKLLWHYQFVHHDLWDRDLPAPPNLVTVMHNGRKVDAVAQVTKSGLIFVFDRTTGEPLFPIDEVPVPASTMPGESASPTQPLPRRPEPFARQTLTENDLSPYAENHAELLQRFRQAHHGAFQPLGLDDTIVFPGVDGGAEWGGAAVDPDGVLYVNANEMAWILRLRKAQTKDELAHLSPGTRAYANYCSACHGPERTGNPASGIPSLIGLRERRSRAEIGSLITTGKGMMPGFPMLQDGEKQLLIDNLFGEEKVEGESRPTAEKQETRETRPRYGLDGYVKFVDNRGYPAISPPWGSLTAINLNTGDKLWQITLGNFKELSPEGNPPTGTENYGGPVVTAGGVLFIAATKDGMFRAFDKKSGDLLWSTELPAAGFATPCTYSIGGKQYIVVACGGTKQGTPKGDSYVAFALP